MKVTLLTIFIFIFIAFIYYSENSKKKLLLILNDIAKRLAPILISTALLFGFKNQIYDTFIRGEINFDFKCKFNSEQNPNKIWKCKIDLKNANDGTIRGRVFEIRTDKNYDKIKNCNSSDNKNLNLATLKDHKCTYVINLEGNSDITFELNLSAIEEPNLKLKEIN